MRTMVLANKFLQNWDIWAIFGLNVDNVGIHLPAPWSHGASGIGIPHVEVGLCDSRQVRNPGGTSGSAHASAARLELRKTQRLGDGLLTIHV